MEQAIEKLAEVLTEQAQQTKALLGAIESQAAKQAEVDKSIEEKIEKALRSEWAKPEVKEDDTEVVGKYFGFLNARDTVRKGQTFDAPMWGSKKSQRFVEWAMAVKNNDQQAITKAFGDNPYTLTTTAGGYLVPEEFRPELIRLTYLRSLALQYARIVPMTTDNMKIPTVATGYSVGWGAINTQTADSKVVFGQVDLVAQKMVGVSLIPNELLMDSALPVATILANEFAEAFAKKLDEEFFDGDSSDTSNHKFNGWGFASSVEAVTGAVDATPTFAELVTEANLLAVVGKLEDRELDGARWFMHPTVWATVRALEDGASSKIVRLNEAYGYDLLGFPTHRTTQMRGTAAASTPAVLFGNPANIVIGDRMQFTIAANEGERFSHDQTVFRATQRVAIAVALPSSIAKLSFGAATT